MTLKIISRLLTISTILLFSFYIPVIAGAKEIDFKPLTLFLSDTPYSAQSYHTDIYSPAGLWEQKGKASFQYGIENILNIKDGEKEGTSAGSITKEYSAILPVRLPVLNESAIGLSIKEFESKANDSDKNKEIYFNSLQSYRSNTFAVSAKPLKILSAGLGIESYPNYSHPFYEIQFKPAEPIYLGYREYRREMHTALSLIKEGHLATVNLTPSEYAKEFSLKVNLPDILMIRVGADTAYPANIESCFIINFGHSLSVGHYMIKRHLGISEDIIIDNVPNGHINGTVDYEGSRLETVYHRSDTNYILGLNQTYLDMEGTGKITGDSLLSFWENLLAGERFFNSFAKINSTHFYLGLEKRSNKNLKLKGELQYIVTMPEGNLDHWTPFPFIKIGKLDEQVVNLQYKKVKLGVIAFGLNYIFHNIEFSYQFSQIIPIKVEKEKEIKGTGEGTVADAGKNGWSLKNLIESIKDNPGGNIQVFKVTWFFS